MHRMGMLELDQPVLEVELRAGVVEGMDAEQFAGRKRLLQAPA